MADRIARSHRPGHIGSTPQDTDAIVAGSRVAGMLEDFTEHLSPKPRVDDWLGRPAVAADPGYFRDDSTALQIAGAMQRSGLNGSKQFTTPKNIGGYKPGTDY